jgi:hypothetical protein
MISKKMNYSWGSKYIPMTLSGLFNLIVQEELYSSTQTVSIPYLGEKRGLRI